MCHHELYVFLKGAAEWNTHRRDRIAWLRTEQNKWSVYRFGKQTERREEILEKAGDMFQIFGKVIDIEDRLGWKGRKRTR